LEEFSLKKESKDKIIMVRASKYSKYENDLNDFKNIAKESQNFKMKEKVLKQKRNLKDFDKFIEDKDIVLDLGEVCVGAENREEVNGMEIREEDDKERSQVVLLDLG
jgi:hypothetical protein